MAEQGKETKPVVILRKKRPAAAPSPSFQRVGQKKPKPSQQTPAPVIKVEAKKSSPLTKPVVTKPTTSSLVTTATAEPQDASSLAPVGPSKAQRYYERRQRFLQSPEFAQISTAMTTRWPHLFHVTPETIRPLAIGIAIDLCNHLPDFSRKNVHLALKQWMADHRIIYWKALMQGGPRYDLEGNPKGEVTPEQQAHAREQRKAWFLQREERNKQRVTTEKDASGDSVQEEKD